MRQDNNTNYSSVVFLGEKVLASSGRSTRQPVKKKNAGVESTETTSCEGKWIIETTRELFYSSGRIIRTNDRQLSTTFRKCPRIDEIII